MMYKLHVPTTYRHEVSLLLYPTTSTKHVPSLRHPASLVSFSVHGKLLTLSFIVARGVVMGVGVVGLGVAGTRPQLSEKQAQNMNKQVNNSDITEHLF